MEKSGTHRRIALKLINMLGGENPRRIVFGFMIASALISMWISNAATTLMLLPIALATLDSFEENNPKVNAALLMGIAFAASIGGIGTPVGTAPNGLLMSNYKTHFGKEVSFLDWMYWGVPIVFILLPCAAYWLTRKLPTKAKIKIPSAGPWREEEIKVLIVFAITALLWITRTDPCGGWKGLLGLQYAYDFSIALIAVVALFLIPDGKGGKILDWESANRIPWGVILLFAGGMCIAVAFEKSGHSQLLSNKLKGITSLHPIILIFSICIFTTFISEVTSNTALTAMLMPILAGAAKEAHINPLILMVPACAAASAAFMFPAGTPPNAIVFGTGQIKSKDMAITGFALNLIGAVIITVVCYIVLIYFGLADKIST
jgi:sodium-dependent dicarboxylate transporter 2/3/5